MTKRMLIMLLGVGIIFGAIFGFQAFKGHMIKKFMAAQGQPPQTVSTIKAAMMDWQPTLKAVGSLRAMRGADLSPELAGIVSAIHFKSGEDVTANTLLLALRADSDIAHLNALKVALELSETVFQRDQEQFKVEAISRAVLDTDTANLKSAKAQVAEQQALVDKKFIRAPFAGRLGIRQIDIGQYLTPGTKIVTLQELDPVFIDFSVAQQDINHLKIGQTITATTDTFPNEHFTGKLSAIDPKVDVDTRNILARATLRNPQHQLLPGMFTNITIQSGQVQHYITLPQTAVTYAPYGDTIFVVQNKGQGANGKPLMVVQQKFVTVGETRGDQVAILKGVSVGDIVVTTGQMKLKNGTPVVINNTVIPKDNAAPDVPNEPQ